MSDAEALRAAQVRIAALENACYVMLGFSTPADLRAFREAVLATPGDDDDRHAALLMIDALLSGHDVVD